VLSTGQKREHAGKVQFLDLPENQKCTTKKKMIAAPPISAPELNHPPLRSAAVPVTPSKGVVASGGSFDFLSNISKLSKAKASKTLPVKPQRAYMKSSEFTTVINSRRQAALVPSLACPGKSQESYKIFVYILKLIIRIFHIISVCFIHLQAATSDDKAHQALLDRLVHAEENEEKHNVKKRKFFDRWKTDDVPYDNDDVDNGDGEMKAGSSLCEKGLQVFIVCIASSSHRRTDSRRQLDSK
jgi:hypothetical protein